MMRFWLSMLFVSLLAVPALAQEAEGPRTLSFYSHPTERYNLLIPPGWENRSTAQGAHLVSDALGLEVYGFSVEGDVEDAVIGWAGEALPGREPVLLDAQDVQLTTGQWTQRLYALGPEDASGALTVYSQVTEGRTFVIAAVADAPLYTVVVPVEGGLADAGGASSALADALRRLGWQAEQVGEMSAPPADQPSGFYQQALAVDGAAYAALVRRSGEQTADVIVGPAERASEQDLIVLTIVRDFFLTPETTAYLGLGLAASFLVLALFIAALVIRQRNLQKDEAALRELAAP